MKLVDLNNAGTQTTIEWSYDEDDDDIKKTEKGEKFQRERFYGPWRILPGHLSISRCFGDFEAKTNSFGQQTEVLIANPVLTSISQDDVDFFVIGCDLIS